MAIELAVDSLKYLSVPDLGPSIGCDTTTLCTGCVTGKYPTPWGNRLMRIARKNPETIRRLYG